MLSVKFNNNKVTRLVQHLAQPTTYSPGGIKCAQQRRGKVKQSLLLASPALTTCFVQMALHLKYLRVQCGLTLEQLAEDSGLTRSYLSKIERGVSSPSIESALKLAKALGVSVERLFGQDQTADPITITRASQSDAADNRMSLIAGMKPDSLMRAFILRPGQTQSRGRIMSHHDGEELLYVLSGRFELHIANRKEVISTGDCVQFDSTIAHQLFPLEPEDCSALIVVAAKGTSGEASVLTPDASMAPAPSRTKAAAKKTKPAAPAKRVTKK